MSTHARLYNNYSWNCADTGPQACNGCDFDIDPYGRPVYNDEEGIYTGLYPLPTHDSFIQNGRAAKRCYVHPIDPVIVSCTAWWLSAPMTSTSSVAVPRATYTSYYDYDESLIAASSEPPVASLPSTSMSYTGSIGPIPTEGPTAAPSPGPATTAQSSGISATAGVPASILELLTLCTILCAVLL